MNVTQTKSARLDFLKDVVAVVLLVVAVASLVWIASSRHSPECRDGGSKVIAVPPVERQATVASDDQ